MKGESVTMMAYDVLLMEPRQRAPRRDGRRTTLTIPHALRESLAQLASEWGTTPNDALIRVAEEAVANRAERTRIAALAAERRAAVEASLATGDGPFLSPEEFQAAVLSGRRD